MRPEYWFIGIGVLLIIMTMITASLKRLPLTTAILYLGFGFVLGPSGFGLVRLDPLSQAGVLEHLAEIAVIISLFTAGLKLRLPLKAREWRVPLALASVSMVFTVVLITGLGIYLFSLPLGAAVLLGAILAPTDPVLASSVQVHGPEDSDQLRFSLTGEAGLNDGGAFPFVMLGLGLLGMHPIGEMGWRWLLLDVLWAIGGGLVVGTSLAYGISRLIGYLRSRHEESQTLDDFLALGLITITYGVAQSLSTYGFLAVFAAGLALRRGERKETQGLKPTKDAVEQRLWSETTSADMAEGVLEFNERLERLAEIVVVLAVGVMISGYGLSARYLFLSLVLFLVIRPLSTLGVARSVDRSQFRLLAWFGLRGIGSIYYLAYVIARGIPQDLAKELTQAGLTVVVASILAHGISSAPLMARRERRRARSTRF